MAAGATGTEDGFVDVAVEPDGTGVVPTTLPPAPVRHELDGAVAPSLAALLLNAVLGEPPLKLAAGTLSELLLATVTVEPGSSPAVDGTSWPRDVSISVVMTIVVPTTIMVTGSGAVMVTTEPGNVTTSGPGVADSSSSLPLGVVDDVQEGRVVNGSMIEAMMPPMLTLLVLLAAAVGDVEPLLTAEITLARPLEALVGSLSPSGVCVRAYVAVGVLGKRVGAGRGVVARLLTVSRAAVDSETAVVTTVGPTDGPSALVS